MGNEGIPYNTIYRVTKQYIKNYSISSDYVDNVRNVLDDVIKCLAEASLERLDMSNNLRKIHSKKQLRRIHKSELQNTAIYKYLYEQIRESETEDSSIEILGLHRQETT